MTVTLYSTHCPQCVVLENMLKNKNGITLVVLVVGATYAWLTIAANVTNGNYSIGTKNFIINYAKGTEITDTVQTSNATTTAITTATTADELTTDGWLAVTASKTASSAKASDFTIKLHIESNTLTTKALTYAVCKGECPTGIELATVSGGIATCGTGVAGCGTIAGNQTNQDVSLYVDTETFNIDGEVPETTYNVYIWLDYGTLAAADIGKSFSGYIHASATQGD